MHDDFNLSLSLISRGGLVVVPSIFFGSFFGSIDAPGREWLSTTNAHYACVPILDLSAHPVFPRVGRLIQVKAEAHRMGRRRRRSPWIGWSRMKKAAEAILACCVRHVSSIYHHIYQDALSYLYCISRPHTGHPQRQPCDST
jgi:hypothetical protein